jgi:hypothetical protein
VTTEISNLVCPAISSHRSQLVNLYSLSCAAGNLPELIVVLLSPLRTKIVLGHVAEGRRIAFFYEEFPKRACLVCPG